MEKQFTPENIQSLPENNIFVFGSNLDGKHYGGAAKVAFYDFGAIMGQAEGLQGQSYAIPTVGSNFGAMTFGEVDTYVDNFIEVAKNNPDKIFWVTKIGCGIAGFTIAEMKTLFTSKELPKNVRIPVEFS